jgi:hypothetical protein
MTAANKVDSNSTGLAYAKEDTIKVLPGSPVWIPLEPNSYTDFGGSVKTVARNPINADRQMKKGAMVDFDASGGWQQDLTYSNLQDLLQGFFFAAHRTKGEAKNAIGVATMTIAVTAASDTFTVGGTGGPADLQTVFAAGDLVFMEGFTNAANNGLFKVVTVAAAYITVCAADGAGGAVTTVNESANSAASIVKVGFESAAGDIDVDDAGSLPALTSTTFDFTTLDLSVGEIIYIGGDVTATKFGTAANNGFARVRSIAAKRLELDKAHTTMVAEANTTLLVQLFVGRCLKNETGADIVRSTYQLERTLGKADSDDTYDQVEYITGAVPNEITMNIPSADKVTMDMSFVGMDHELVDGATGPKGGGTYSALPETDMFNTSSDFSRIKIAVHSDSNEAATALFGYCTELSLTISNNVTGDKAVGVAGAFDATAGNFKVSGSVTAYFTDIAAISAVRNNSTVTLDIHMVKNNKGISIDLPVLTLGDGRASVEQDKAITLPITCDAASGSFIDTDMDHTLLMVFFDYLPSAADA